MSPRILLLTCSVIFIVCCSMSQCSEDKTPGPSTLVHGVVNEAKTNKPLANIRLQITKEYTAFLAGTKYEDYAVITTGADGTYDHRFIPIGKGTFFLHVLNTGPYVDMSLTGRRNMELGATNDFNFLITRLVNLKVNLKNITDQGKTGFHVFISPCCDAQVSPLISDFISKVIIDTAMTYKLPQLTTYTCQSLFFNGYFTSGQQIGLFKDTLSFKKNFYLGGVDTTINVVNP